LSWFLFLCFSVKPTFIFRAQKKKIALKAARAVAIENKAINEDNATGEDKVSISLTFYKQLFCMHRGEARSFYVLAVWLCKFFCRKNFGEKAAPKMLVKLSAGVNFINI